MVYDRGTVGGGPGREFRARVNFLTGSVNPVAVAMFLKMAVETRHEKRKDMEKPTQNIQDGFLNSARKEKSLITIYLVSGVKLTGRIRSFDRYSVVLESGAHEQLIFKHAISTVVLPRPGAAAFSAPAAHAPVRPSEG
jgi:host factor-I protein